MVALLIFASTVVAPWCVVNSFKLPSTTPMKSTTTTTSATFQKCNHHGIHKSFLPERRTWESSPLGSTIDHDQESEISSNMHKNISLSETTPLENNPPPTTDESTNISIYNKNNNNVTGIGGEGGIVYDVNKVKRNLVQDTVRAAKLELLDLLSSPRGGMDGSDGLFEDRLSALVQINPVSTTTDSNLLDGSWELAYVANNATQALDLSRKYGIVYTSTASSSSTYTTNLRPWQLDGNGKTESPFRSRHCSIHLEDLGEDEDAYVEDRTDILGGLLVLVQKHKVVGLTRTSLDLVLVDSKCSLGLLRRKWIVPLYSQTNNEEDETLSKMEVLYLDSDLCVCVMSKSHNNDHGGSNVVQRRGDTGQQREGRLVVYTKSEKWTGSNERTRRRMRQLQAIPSWFYSLQSPFRIRNRLSTLLFPNRYSPNNPNNDPFGKTPSPIFLQKTLGTSDITVLKIGGNADSDNDQMAWEGDEDPFAHLDAMERQRVIKNMSIHEINKARKLHKASANTRRVWTLGRSNKDRRNRWKTLKKPPNNSS